jgi:Domain of unknown function (DUF4190)/zinc-ribbon domain
MTANYCNSCGAELPPGRPFCANCGRPVDGPAPGSLGSMRESAGQTSGKAVASLALGVAGFVVVPVVCSVLAIILGSQAKHEIEANPRLGGDGIARAGVILGWVGLVFSVVALVLIFAIAASMSHV